MLDLNLSLDILITRLAIVLHTVKQQHIVRT